MEYIENMYNESDRDYILGIIGLIKEQKEDLIKMDEKTSTFINLHITPTRSEIVWNPEDRKYKNAGSYGVHGEYGHIYFDKKKTPLINDLLTALYLISNDKALEEKNGVDKIAKVWKENSFLSKNMKIKDYINSNNISKVKEEQNNIINLLDKEAYIIYKSKLIEILKYHEQQYNISIKKHKTNLEDGKPLDTDMDMDKYYKSEIESYKNIVDKYKTELEDFSNIDIPTSRILKEKTEKTIKKIKGILPF